MRTNVSWAASCASSCETTSRRMCQYTASLYLAIKSRNPLSASFFRVETISASFSAAIRIRFGHSQTLFKGDTIRILFCPCSLLCDNHHLVTVRMVAVRFWCPWMSMHCGAGSQHHCHSDYRHHRYFRKPASLSFRLSPSSLFSVSLLVS